MKRLPNGWYDLSDPDTFKAINNEGTLGPLPTQSLFAECPQSKVQSRRRPVYSLLGGLSNKTGLPSAKDIYMELLDPTEYKPALAILGSWKHWKVLTESVFFTPYIESWREELEILLRSKGFVRMMETASNPDHRSSVAAAKYLSDRGWKESSSPRGRPTKRELEKAKKAMLEAEKSVNEDAERLGLTLQ